MELQSSIFDPRSSILDPRTLRSQLFLSSALLSTLILIIAAWVINNQFVRQARQQVQAEVETLLPLYDAVWNEQARRLATMGTTMANSPIVKTIFGYGRASRNRETLHEMIVDSTGESSEEGDLFLITDGAGQVIFAEQREGAVPEIKEMAAATKVGESQAQSQSFALLDGRLFQLVLTPVVLHSGSDQYNNTLAVLGTGSELNAAVAQAVELRIHSDVAFFVGDRLHASSLPPGVQKNALEAITSSEINKTNSSRPTEIEIAGEDYLAFARQLTDFDGERIGQAVVLRSLAGSGQFFRAISNRLLLLWTLGIAAAWLLSYLIAGRITRPIESLQVSARQFGQGNYDHPAPIEVHGEIGQLARAFDQMRRSLKRTQAALLKNERLATIGQMASSIIHDLRNPLATISTAAEVLKSDGLSPDRRHEMIETQLQASYRMNAMLGEILDFSRGSYKLNRKGERLATIVEGVAGDFRSRMNHLRINLKINVPAEIVVEADPERIGRVFENLLVNAIQAIQEDGVIEISAVEEDSLLRVEVIDDGPGVPAQIRERIFEPFVSHGKKSGTGLGLAIARGIIEAHGGKIGLAEATERGARFYIELPCEPGSARIPACFPDTF